MNRTLSFSWHGLALAVAMLWTSLPLIAAVQGADNPPTAASASPAAPTASELIRRAEAASKPAAQPATAVPAAPTIVDPIVMPTLTGITPSAAPAASPTSAGTPEAAAPSLEVSVLPSGSILVGGNVYPAENLTETFRKIASENQGKGLRIRATAATAADKVAAVATAARNAGIAQIEMIGQPAVPAVAPVVPSSPAPAASAPMPPPAVELNLTKPEPAPALAAPAASVAPAPAVADSSITNHTVQAGDTFSAIAKKYYNDENKFTVIAQANPGVDSSRLKIGQIIKVPTDLKALEKQREARLAEVGKTAEKSGAAQSVTVHGGDTLYGISKRVYGSSNYYKAIYEANKDKLKNPEQTLKVGMELKIPPKPAKP